MSAAAPAPPPALGSARYFMWLYCPRPKRRALTTLLALGEQLSAGIERQLDHSLAHGRLQWWRQEAQRFAQGAPEHPWLIAWRREGDPELNLAPLIEAAAIDLASQQLAGTTGHRLTQALVVAAARVLTLAPLSPGHEQSLRELGGWLGQLESGAAQDALAQLHQAPVLIEPGLQPQLGPVLVWIALAAHHARRRARRAGAASAQSKHSRFDGLVDNITAWRVARRAARGQFHLEDVRTDECHG